MKKRMFVLALSVALACTLAACGCKHQWLEATCVAPKTCTACGATEGEALGHDFVPASCSVPETCTRCGEIGAEALGHEFLPATCENPEVCIHCGKEQGEALGHSYSKWVIAEDAQTMSRQCSVCQSGENLPVDHSRILKDELQGHWDLYSVSKDGQSPVSAYQLDPSSMGIYLNFEEGNHGVFFANQEGYPKDVTWEFVGYDQDNSIYYFRIAEDGGISLSAAYAPQENDEDDIIAIVDGTWQYWLARNTVTTQAVEGLWADIQDGQLYTAKFSSDNTFTGNFNGQVSGIWLLRPPASYVNSNYRFCEILLRYTQDDSTQIVWGSIDLGPKDVPLEEYLKNWPMRISIHGQDFSVSMEPITEEDLPTLEAAIAEGEQLLIGPWTSTHIDTSRNGTSSESQTTDYSITFEEDGTFTAVLDRQRNGTWRFDSADISGSVNHYTYQLSFDGVDGEVAAHYSNDKLNFSRYGETYTTIYFQQMTEEKIAQREAQQQEAMAQIKGDWTSYLLSEFNYADDSRLHRSTLNCTLQIREDGTFTAKLDKERAGTWEFRELSTYDSQDYVYKTYHYRLQLEGVEEPLDVTVDSWGNLEFDLPIENGRKTLAFRQLTAQDVEAMEQLREKCVGSWTAVSARTHDYNTQADAQMTDCDYTITIREDGTYTAQFSRPISGVWYIKFTDDGSPLLFICEGMNSTFYSLDEEGFGHTWHEVNDHVSVEVRMKKNG